MHLICDKNKVTPPSSPDFVLTETLSYWEAFFNVVKEVYRIIYI